MNRLQWQNRGLSVAAIYVKRKVRKPLKKLFRRRPNAKRAQASGEAGHEMVERGGDKAAAGGDGLEDEVVVRQVDALESGVGGLSEVEADGTGATLRRVGQLIDELLGDQLVHPHTNLHKNFAHKQTRGAHFLRTGPNVLYSTAFSIRIKYNNMKL